MTRSWNLILKIFNNNIQKQIYIYNNFFEILFFFFSPILENIVHGIVCTKKLVASDLKTFQKAVREHYWFQLFLDDLPVWGMVGELDGNSPYIYTHLVFSISYNKDRIVEVNMTSENPILLTDKIEDINFIYSVNWTPTTKSFKSRFDKYLDNDFFEHQIHWFSIFNSLMMVLFLAGLVIMILLRVLKKDFATKQDEEDLEMESVGWKQLHADVFRAPSYLSFFSALLGTSYHLALCFIFVIIVSIAGQFYTG